MNSPEYIANQYSKLYFEGVSVFDMLDIIDNITLDSINETATKFLNINNMVDSRLEPKSLMRALVLGGSGTIGTAIVERLLEEGNEVIIQYFQSDLKALQDKYKGEAVEFIQADLTQNIDLETTFAHIKYLDCLIYSSGTALYGLLQDMSDIDIDLSYNIHVKQLIRCCRYFIDLIRQSEFGRIIVISSIWGETGASMETIYSAMKSAQIGFVKALSQELAMTNVTVNAITPGFVSGNMSQVLIQMN